MRLLVVLFKSLELGLLCSLQVFEVRVLALDLELKLRDFSQVLACHCVVAVHCRPQLLVRSLELLPFDVEFFEFL